MMDFWETKLSPITSIVFLVALIAVEPYYRQTLFDASIPAIIALQSTATPEMVSFMKLVSDIGSLGLIIGVLVISFLFFERSKAFYYTSLFSQIVLIMGIGKIAYHSPRPYMVSDDVQVFGCSTEFGHPSGHSINSMTFCIAILLDFLASCPSAPSESKLITTVICVGTPLLVGFSRLYNGDHSMD
jgi:membrane-associated phospholipid phosphatase